MIKPSPFRSVETSREIIHLAVMLYVRFQLLECAPWVGHFGKWNLTLLPGFRSTKAYAETTPTP
jgi:hypothetical protein